MSDLISRQAAIDALSTPHGILYPIRTVEELPSAQPERKKGKWECGDDMFEYAICSSCKWDSGEAWEYALKHFKFCPNCGAKMKEGDQK